MSSPQEQFLFFSAVMLNWDLCSLTVLQVLQCPPVFLSRWPQMSFPVIFLIAKIFQNFLVSGNPAAAAAAGDGEPGPAAEQRPLAKTMLTPHPHTHRVTHFFL